jgi:hypothetical protein
VSQRLSRVTGGGLLQRRAQVTDSVGSKLTILHELRGNVERLTAAVDAGRLSEFDKRMLAFALNLIDGGRSDRVAGRDGWRRRVAREAGTRRLRWRQRNQQ